MTQTKQLFTGIIHHKTNIQTKLLCKDTVQSEKVQTLVIVFKIGIEFGMTVRWFLLLASGVFRLTMPNC